MAKVTNGVSLPAEAVAQVSLNESTPAAERAVAPVVELVDGPIVDEKTGAYLPAAYRLPDSTIVRIDR